MDQRGAFFYHIIMLGVKITLLRGRKQRSTLHHTLPVVCDPVKAFITQKSVSSLISSILRTKSFQGNLNLFSSTLKHGPNKENGPSLHSFTEILKGLVHMKGFEIFGCQLFGKKLVSGNKCILGVPAHLNHFRTKIYYLFWY